MKYKIFVIRYYMILRKKYIIFSFYVINMNKIMLIVAILNYKESILLNFKCIKASYFSI